MIDSTLALIIGIVVGLAGGFLNSILKWLEGTEDFNTRKNISALIIGGLTGLGLAIAMSTAFTDGVTDIQFVVLIVGIFLSAAGVSTIAPKAARAAAKGAIERNKPT